MIKGKAAARELQAHALEIDALCEEARLDYLDAYDAAASEITDGSLPDFFVKLDNSATKILGSATKMALAQVARHAKKFDAGSGLSDEDIAEIADLVERSIREDVRHVRVSVGLRVKRMRLQGTGDEIVTELLLADLREGGRSFSRLRTGVARTLAAGVNEIAQAARNHALNGDAT